MIDVEQVKEEIKRRGPTRVMVETNYATTPDLALLHYGIVADTVFIRDDGWSLGAPRQFEQAAYRMWKDSWVDEMQL